MKSTKDLQDRLTPHYHCAYRLSRKLLAWAALLERQSDCEGYTELMGLGLSLRAYSRRLRRLAHGLDLIQVDLEARTKEGRPQMSEEKKTASESLEQMIERFLKEKSGLGLLSMSEVARLHLHLLDSTLPLLHVGYVRFLKSCGVSAPKITDLSEFWIGEYHEFLHQNYGELVMQEALDSLWLVWDWASQNGYISEKMPGCLDDLRTPPSFRTTLKIEDRPATAKRP